MSCGLRSRVLLAFVWWAVSQPGHAQVFEYSETVKPIFGRVLTFEPQEYNKLFNILGDRDFVAITNQQTEELLHRPANTSAMLDTVISGLIAYAEKREALTKIDFFSKNASDLQKEANLQREYAAYLEGLRGKLRPYLVKTNACYDHPKNKISIDLKQHLLNIQSICPGSGPVITKPVPIIVFVETTVQKVELDIDAFE